MSHKYNILSINSYQTKKLATRMFEIRITTPINGAIMAFEK